MTELAKTDEAVPVAWSNPEHEQLSWWHERWHFPDPVTPLAFDYAEILFSNANRANQAKGEPGAIRVERINTNVYLAFGPPSPDDPPPLGTEPQPDRFDNHATWDTLWLPEIQSYLERWEAFDRGSASGTELAEFLDGSLTWLARCFEIHFRLNFGPDELFTFVADALGWTHEEASDLVLGVDSKSIEGDDALRSLARLAADTPTVRDAFLELEKDQLLAALATSEDARQFLARFDEYLDQFGRRSDNFHDIAMTTWIEDPTPVLAMLTLYVRQPEQDPEAVRRGADAKRVAAQQRARAEFAERAPDRLGEFERELAFGLRANALNEDHNYWLDQQTMYWGRMDMLAAGDRLVASGAIAARDDVFMLTLAHVRAALVDPADLRETVEAARRELVQWADVDPPGMLGAPMPAEMRPMVAAAFGQLESTSTATQVRGMSASGGVVTGVARLIASLDDADRLGDGDILVTETTSPPWTPLFGIAGAVVTDAGGPMSHVAIVAREYGIPAVVGTANATKLIRDGQRLRVDGSLGIVDLLED